MFQRPVRAGQRINRTLHSIGPGSPEVDGFKMTLSRCENPTPACPAGLIDGVSIAACCDGVESLRMNVCSDENRVLPRGQ